MAIREFGGDSRNFKFFQKFILFWRAIREFQRFENSHVLKWFNDSRFPTNWQTFEWKLKEIPTLSWFSESGNVFYWSHSTWIPFLFENWCSSCRNPSPWSWDNWQIFRNFIKISKNHEMLTSFKWKLKVFPALSWFSETGNVFSWSHKHPNPFFIWTLGL